MQCGDSVACTGGVWQVTVQTQFRAVRAALDGVREVTRGFAETDRRFDRVEQRLDRMEAVVLAHERPLRDVNIQLGDLRTAVDRKVDRDELEGIVERAVGHGRDTDPRQLSSRRPDAPRPAHACAERHAGRRSAAPRAAG